MENETIATNADTISETDASNLLAAFDPSYETKKEDFASPTEETRLNEILRNPDQIESLTDDEADALYEEGNRIYCKNGYDYMMVNGTHDRDGKQYEGVIDAQTRTWTPKAGLKQMAQDIVVRNAAIQGVDALANLLHGNNGKRLGWTGEQYVNATIREKAARIKEVGAISGGDSLKEGLKNWWNSWSLYSEMQDGQAKSKENMLKYGPDADVKYEACVWDWSEYDASIANEILNDAVDSAVKTGFNRTRRNFETGGVDTYEETYKNRDEFAQAVYNAPNHVFKSQNGDIFSATLTGKGKYRLELARGGETENCHRIVSFVEDKNQNERNAMNGIIMREMFNANPELLKWYKMYDNSRKDNSTGMFNRKGDTDALLSSFMEDFAPYAKSDSELTPEEIEIRDGKVATFQQLCEVLSLDDKREGFRSLGGGMSKFFSGVGNTALEFGYELGGLFGEAGHQYRKWLWDSWGSSSKENYFNQFKSWAEEDLRAVTSSELYDQGSLIGTVGGEAAKLFAFSALMKSSTFGRIASTTGKSVNATGRAMKLAGLEKTGQKLKSVGAKIDAAGRAVGGGTTVAYRKITVPANGKMPKDAVKIGDEYFAAEKVKVGNFMQRYNAKAARLDENLMRQKAVAADIGGKIGVREEYLTKVYDEIASIEKDIQSMVGGNYGVAKQWVLEMANELPAVMTVASATAATHTAMSAYKIGEGFLERDESGKVIGAKFDPKAMDTVEEYAVYDALGNSVFLFKLNRLLDGVMKGQHGSAKLQQSTRNWYKSVVEMYQNGEYDKASALVAMLDNEIRKRAVSAAHMGLVGAEMTTVGAVVGNAEDIALRKLKDKNYVPSAADYALNEDQAIEVLKSGLRMAAGGAAVGELAGSKKIIEQGELPYLRKFNELRATNKFDALSRDSWAIAAGVAHKTGKKEVVYDNLSNDPIVASKQVRRQAAKDEEAYRAVTKDTNEFISRVITIEAQRMLGKKYESRSSIRQDMVNRYGETYARIMDGIMEHVKNSRTRTAEFGMTYANEKLVSELEARKFEEYAPKEVMEGIEKLLGVKGRRPQDNKDGTFTLRFDVDGKNGWLNLTYKPHALDAEIRLPDGKFAKGWSVDVMNGLEGKNEADFDKSTFGDLIDKVAKLDESVRAAMRNGEDHDGILAEAQKRTTSTGAFVVEGPNGEKIAKMNSKTVVGADGKERGVLSITDFAHETVHGIIETLRDRGYFKGKNGENREEFLVKKYGKDWEEGFISDLLTADEMLLSQVVQLEGVQKLEESPLTRLLSGVARIMRLPSMMKRQKPVRSRVEVALDNIIEDAKNLREEEIIDEKAEEIKSNLEENAEANTPAQNSLVVSQLPVPNSVFMEGVSDADKPARVKELNESGFYYDSQLDAWVNEHSAPTVYHRAVNEVVATKVERQHGSNKIAWDLYKQLLKEQDKTIRMAKIQQIKNLILPEEFTEAERKQMGILVSESGEPIGIINRKDGIVTDGDSLRIVTGEFPKGSRIEPYSHDKYHRWCVKDAAKASGLIALHNLPLKYFNKFFKDEGSAGLSVAIMPKGKSHNGFGIATIVFGKKSVDLKKKDAEGRPLNYLFNEDMGLPDMGYIMNVDENGNVVRNRMQGVNDEWADAMNPDGSLKRYGTLKEIAEGFALFMNYDHEMYPSPMSKKARVKNLDKLRSMIDAEGNLPKIYAELKQARLVESGEAIGAILPRLSESSVIKVPTEKSYELNVDGIKAICAKTGAKYETVAGEVQKIIDAGQFIPEQFKSLVNEIEVPIVDVRAEIAEAERICKANGIPIEYWDCGEINVQDATHFTWVDATAKRAEAVARLQERVPEMVFNVVGVRGASRFFGGKAGEVSERINLIVRTAIEQTDIGTRAGLLSSKNANINKTMTGLTPAKVGPFFIHVGGTDGDKGARLEYVGKKPKIPQGFLKRIASGETFHVYDVMGNAVRQDDILAKSYPEIMNAQIFISNSKQSAEAGVKEPAWRDDNTFIIANEDGQIVINQKRWNANKASEQFAQALVGMIQKEEGWEQRIRQSDDAVSKALVPTRAKRKDSELAFWLTDTRLISSAGVGPIVRKALRDRLGDKVDEALLKQVSEVIWGEIDNSVKQFAGEAEARFLASRFGMTEEQLADYSAAEEALKDTLVTLDSKNLTSAQQTKKNLQYWEDVIIKAVDAAVFNHHQGSHGACRADIRSIRPEFKEAVADEIMEAIVKNILEAKRAVRTQTEAEMTGVEVGEKAKRIENAGGVGGEEVEVEEVPVDYESEGSRLSAGFEMMNASEDGWDESSGGRTLITSGTTVVNAVEAGLTEQARSIDVRWERNKAKVSDIIKEEVSKMKASLVKDPSKAESFVKKFTDTLYKIVAENSSTTDVNVQQSMLNEAIRMSGIGSFGKMRVVGNRHTPQSLITQAASARLAKQWLDGKRSPSDDANLKSWIEKKAGEINIPESRRANFVADVMNSAVPIAEQLYRRFKGSKHGVNLIKAAEESVAVNELTKRVVDGAIGGYNIGKAGQEYADRAVAEAKRLQAREVKDARGIGLAELNSLIGYDIIRGIENLKEEFGNGDTLATKSIKSFADNFMRNDNRFAGMSYDEFANSEIARAELASTVAAWLKETAKRLGYGQVREWAMREAARMQKQHQTFGSIHMTMAKYADMLSESIGKQNVGQLLDSIDKNIDEFADGAKQAAVSIPDYERKIAPRLQDYWHYVKKVMRMTEAEVEKEVAKQNNLLKLSDMQLLELGKKDASDLDANEELAARDKAMLKLNALTKYGAMKYKTYGECRDIFDQQMSRDLAGAIQKHLVARNARLADDARIRQAFIGELTSIRRNKKGDDFDKIDNGTKGSNFLMFSIADLFKRFNAYLHEGTEAYNFIDSFRQDMSLANIDKTMFISKWEGEMRKACERIYGINFEKLVPDMMLKNEAYDKFSRSAWYIPENGVKVEVNCGNHTKKVVLAKAPDGTVPTNIPNHLSKANLVYIYAACQQADMQVNNAIWGRNAKYFRDIEDIIGPEGIAMAQWLTKAYGEIRKTISPVSEAVSGMPVLSPDENYCPLSFEQDLVSVDERRFSSSPFPSFLTRRVTHDSLRLNEQCDAFRMFEDKIQDSGHYLGYAKIIDRMNSTLKHPKVQTAYAQLLGTKAKNDVYAQLADALNGGRKNSDTLLTGVRNFVTATSLFGNFGSALKQLEGIGGWSVEMGIGPWVKGLIRNPMTSAEVRQGVRELIDAGLFVTRECEGISEAMVSLMNSCEGMPEGPMSKGYRWYKRHGMDITKWVDKIASMSMAGQYYTGRKNWYIENGITEVDAKRKALADTDYAIQTTQQSGRAEFLHSAQRAGTAGKMITQFSGPAFVRWGIECETWHRAMMMGDKGAWSKLASRLIALHIICPSILSLAGGISGMLFKRDDQKMKDIVERTEKDIVANCITGPMSGWFIWGQLINAFAYENVLPDIKGARSKTHFEAPVLSKLHSLQQMTTKMYKDIEKTAPWDYFSPREQKLIQEDAWRIFEMLLPAARLATPVKNAVEQMTEE